MKNRHISIYLAMLLIVSTIVIYAQINSIKLFREAIEQLQIERDTLYEDNKTLQKDVIESNNHLEDTMYNYNRLLDKIHELESRDYVGEFKLTWYTAGYESTGKTTDHPEYGITATGERVDESITIASDWNVLPPGTRVYIESIGEKIVQDKGGGVKGNHIDIYVDSLQVATNNGVKMANVWIIKD